MQTADRKDRIVVPTLLGPTAAGKSAIALELAERNGCAIISCDSRQIYRYMEIGTAKPTLAERACVPHYLIDIVDPDESYSVSRFVDDASSAIHECSAHGLKPLLVGGTGLYFETLRRGLGPQVASDPELRTKLSRRAVEEGSATLHRELQQADPEAARAIHPNDAQRVIRALAVFLQTGRKISELRRLSTPPEEFDFRAALLFPPREELYSRIDRRVDAMIQSGLWEEFAGLRARGYDDETPGLRCLGYQELFAVEKGECSLQSATETIKQNSRRFAKRQLSWFRAHNSDPIVSFVESHGLPTMEVARMLGLLGG